MTDRKNVIKALEHCKDNQYVNDCNECDYGGKTGMFCIRMIDDAIALLKEQEEKMKHLNNITLEYEKEVFRLQTLLKEQEAVTIKKTKEHGFGVYGGICPKCRNWIQSAHSFCGFCGQAVKWNEG